MNFYVVVEGITEKKVYEKWIKYVNPSLKYVKGINEIVENNYIIFTGFGFPFYYQIIDNAIDDINTLSIFDKLVIIVDSEDMKYNEKYDEIKNYVATKHCKAEIKIVVQHFCLETWLLGNRNIITRNPQSLKLLEYLHYFNVVNNDPELLTEYKKERLTRSQFAFRYLKTAVNEKYRNLTYSKNNPHISLNSKYYSRVKKHFEETGHINSFNYFIDAFKK